MYIKHLIFNNVHRHFDDRGPYHLFPYWYITKNKVIFIDGTITSLF
jgi:hypothetical protein